MKKVLVLLLVLLFMFTSVGYVAETTLISWLDDPRTIIEYKDGEGREGIATREGRGHISFRIPENIFPGSAITALLGVWVGNDQEYGVRLTVPEEFKIIPVTSLVVGYAEFPTIKTEFFPPLLPKNNIIDMAVLLSKKNAVIDLPRTGLPPASSRVLEKQISYVLEPTIPGEFTFLAEILKNNQVQERQEVNVNILPLPEGQTASWERSASFGEVSVGLTVHFRERLAKSEQTTATMQKILANNIEGIPTVTFKSSGNFTLTNEGTFPLDATLQERTSTTIDQIEGKFLEGWVIHGVEKNQIPGCHEIHENKGFATTSWGGSLRPEINITNIQNFGRVFGYVRNCLDRPIEGLELRLNEETVLTNTKGFYEFTDVALGRQEIQIIPPEVDGEITKIEVIVRGEDEVALEATKAELVLNAAQLEKQADFVLHGAEVPADFPWVPIFFVPAMLFLLLVLRRRKKRKQAAEAEVSAQTEQE